MWLKPHFQKKGEKNLDKLKLAKTTLFKGMSEDDIKQSLSELKSTELFYVKNTTILCMWF